MTKPTAHQLHQIQQRALVLKLTGYSDRAALRQAAAEAAAQAKAAGAAASSPVPASASSLSKPHAELMETFNRWIGHIWSRKRKPRVIPRRDAPEPSMAAAPVVIHEPVQPLSSDPKLASHFPAPLVVTSFSSAKIIPSHEFPKFGNQDEVAKNWRASIEQNEALARHRAQQSAAHRSRTRYLG
jgi:hypothetical protein